MRRRLVRRPLYRKLRGMRRRRDGAPVLRVWRPMRPGDAARGFRLERLRPWALGGAVQAAGGGAAPIDERRAAALARSSGLQETEGDRHDGQEEQHVQNEVHRVGRRMPDGRWKYLVRSLEKPLIVQSALICAEYPGYPPTLNLKHSPRAIANQPEPDQPHPALPNAQGEKQNREQHGERKPQDSQSLTFTKKCNQSLSGLIVPRTEWKPEDGLKVRRQHDLKHQRHSDPLQGRDPVRKEEKRTPPDCPTSVGVPALISQSYLT